MINKAGLEISFYFLGSNGLGSDTGKSIKFDIYDAEFINMGSSWLKLGNIFLV